MEIVAYTLPGCSHCKTLKELFKRAKTDYTEVVVKRDIPLDEFESLFPGVNMFPLLL